MEPDLYGGVTENEIHDIEQSCGSCQSLDSDAHGKVVRLAKAFREAVAEIEALKHPKPKAKPKAKK